MEQTDIVRDHLQEHGSITSLEAAQMYGITRLAAVVFKLKRDGMDISTIRETGKNRYGKSVWYARYVLGVAQ